MSAAAAMCSASAAAIRCWAAPSPIPDGIEGRAGTVEGLGLLDIATVMSADKSTTLVSGTHCATGAAIEGYEIHLGRSEGRRLRAAGADDRRPRPMARARPTAGCRAPMSTGCSPATPFAKRGWPISASLRRWPTRRSIESALDALADHLEAHLDIEQILTIARSRQTTSASAA